MTTAIPARRPMRRADEDAERFGAYRRDRDRRVRDQLFIDYLPLAESCARRYRRRGEPDEDLFQVAGIGLLKAIDRYDPGRGTCFSSYAVPTIVGELQRHFRDHGWTVRPPRGLQEDVLRLERARAELLCELAREPTAPELAAAAGVTLEEVLEAREAARARGGTSLDAPVGTRRARRSATSWATPTRASSRSTSRSWPTRSSRPWPSAIRRSCACGSSRR